MADQLDRLKTALADRYAIEREIGAGGMATVYLAQDLKHHREVAVKVLQPDLSVAIGTERFLREIEIAAQLTHPRILPLHDSGKAAGFLYYVMPYIEGETLRGRIRREKQLSVEDALEITREVADALSYAHSLGVIHRDIKPENVLMASGHAVVADFGIARAITEAGGERLTETGLSVGTPAYMSPEQAMGEQDVDARSDIYSLGCVAYEMLAGDPPFAGTNPQAILARKTLEPPPPLRTARDTVPESVERPILKALAKTPADRFGTAGEFHDALVVTPASGTAAAARPRRLAGSRALALVALLAVAVAVAGRWAWSTYFDTHIESVVVLPFYNATGDPDQDYLAAGMHDALIQTLNQVGALKVTSLISAMRYKDSEKPIPQIARELGVDAVVEAAVRRQGDSINLAVQLIDAHPKERELWSQPFDGNINDVLGMYNDVARAVAREARVELTSDQEDLLGSARQVRKDTYEHYLRGMHALRKGTVEDAQRGLAHLYKAIEDDPDDPLAYATLAMGYIVAAHGPNPPLGALEQAKANAEKALSLDSTLAETLTALAFLKGYYEFQWDEAEQMFLRALEMKPSLDMAHYWYSWQLVLFDRMDEAWEYHLIAQELDPLNPLHTAGVAVLYQMEGQYDEAVETARQALELDPQNGLAIRTIVEVYAAQGRHEEAIALAGQAGPRDRGWITGRQLALAGRTDEARAIAAELESEGSDPWIALNLAILYASLGDNDKAFHWLNTEPMHCWASWSRVSPIWERLWDDPRLAEFMKERNLPWPRTANE